MDLQLSQLVASTIVLERTREAEARARLHRESEAVRPTVRPPFARLAEIAGALRIMSGVVLRKAG